MTPNSFIKKLILFVSVFSLQCTQVAHRSNLAATPNLHLARNIAVTTDKNSDWIEDLPGEAREYQPLVAKEISPLLKKGDAASPNDKKIEYRISKYLGFLFFNQEKIRPGIKPEVKANLVKKTLKRLLENSTQFLMCPDISDYECIEKVPELPPSLSMRSEDPRLNLGKTLTIDDSLESNLEWYFTKQIFTSEKAVNQQETLASVLAKKIRTETKDGVYMALYGIDDVENSMKDVYSALDEKIKAGLDVRAVFDQQGPSKEVTNPLIFTYLSPSSREDQSNWILEPGTGNKTKLSFMYNVGTQALIQSLAQNAQNDLQVKGRLEYPNDGIMHNKFFVFKDGRNLSVWTGTANVARTCMGTERNSNMSVFIRNTEVARAYLDEFNEMYEYQESPAQANNRFVGRERNGFPVGRFHRQKRPNTHRLFHFAKDNSDLKVYFSPTDDGEHRAILPMLHSAKPGDIIRISMFGAAGIEYVRALQLAASRGVQVQIILDSPTAFGRGSWAGSPGVGDSTLREKNPFDLEAKIDLKKNSRGKDHMWKQNHQKIGVLLRQIDGKYFPEQIIFGSQNWSSSGNDLNDENLIALRNRQRGLRIAADFDDHFRNFLWPHGVDITNQSSSQDSDDSNDSDDSKTTD